MTIHFKTREFKETLKIFAKFAAQTSQHDTPTITFAFDPFRMVMVTEHAFVSAEPTVSIEPPVCQYTFNPEILLNLSLSGEDIDMYWENATSPLLLKNKYLTTSLKVATTTPDFGALPVSLENFTIPLGILIGVNKFLSIPFVFYTGKKEMMPVRFRKNEEGVLEISADDGFSLAKITTEVPITIKDFDIKVPKYMLECLYSKGELTDETEVSIGIKDLKSLFSNKTIQVYASGMTDETSDFTQALSNFEPTVSCSFNPKQLSEAIKPLVSLLPKKDRSGTILATNFKQKMSMHINHQDIGNGIIETVEGIDEIYLENSASSATINMHPTAFQEYTDLLEVENAMLYANNRMVHYKGEIGLGELSMKIEYLFPTVQV